MFMKSMFIIFSAVVATSVACSSYFSKPSTQKSSLVMASNRTLNIFQEKEKEWSGPFFFIQAADTQFGMIEGYLEKKPNPGWKEEIELTKKAIKAANQMNPKPKFFIVCGDLVDAMPGIDSKPEQIKDLKTAFRDMRSDVPLICVCGNHDVGNTPTKESIDSYQKDFGDDYFSYWVGGVKFLVLNSQLYEDSSMVPELANEQDLWLDKQLATVDKPKHLVIFQHIPWFLRDPNEEKEYFNIDPVLRQKMLEKFELAGVKTIFCGHYHRNAGGFYKNMELVVTSAIGAQLGNDLSGLRIVKVFEDKIQHSYYALDDIPKDIELIEN